MGKKKGKTKWFSTTAYGKQLAPRKYYGATKKGSANLVAKLKAKGWALARAVKTEHGYDVYAKEFF